MVDTPLARVTAPARRTDETDADAWREFVRLYGPVVYGFARRRGLRDADAADLMREALRGVARDPGTIEYDPRLGTSGGRLFTVTCERIRTFFPVREDRPPGTGRSGTRANSVPDRRAEPDSDWDFEYQRRLAVRAMGRVKHEFRLLTWQAFWRTAVDGRPVRDVGPELGMTPGAVCVAKSRVLARVREEVHRLEERNSPAEPS